MQRGCRVGKMMGQQRGFSLVEMMIALMLSLLVVGGLYAALIGDKKSYQATRANHLLVSKNRMSMQTLQIYLQQAGFRDFQQLYQNTLLPQVNSEDSAGFTWDEGQFIQGLENQNSYLGAKPNTDVVSLRFYGAALPNSSIFSCNGDELAANSSTSLSFFVSTTNQLICRDSGGDTVFDQDIDSLQLLYGSRDEHEYKYYKASEVSDWRQINRVKVALLVAQEVPMGNLSNQNRYSVLDEDIAISDKKLRQVVNETILLINVGS
ncbi:PilW family protein [Agarivorans sp. QJM3NY_29]|uniref:PilW family protein n=1 Tax=unclassified Agarivorans TaxID=2636026 RepID=UPI003D7E44B9